PRQAVVDEREARTEGGIHRTADRYLVGPVEGRGAQVPVRDRPVERGELVVGARDVGRHRNHVQRMRVRIRREKLEPVAEPLLQLQSEQRRPAAAEDRKSTRLNSSHLGNSYAVFCLKKKNKKYIES